MKTNTGIARVFACTFLVVFGSAISRADVVFEWVTVGNAGNAADDTGFGAVAYEYRISKYEVTNDQYTEFLNAVDPMGDNPNGLWNVGMGSDALGGISYSPGAANGMKYSTKTNMANKPVNYVSFFDAMRFTNWLENGQTGGGTESGVYSIDSGINEVRSLTATFFIPSEDEWYKAAYHQPSSQGGDIDDYFLYPTASNTAPVVATANASGDISNFGSNVANYARGADWNGSDGNVTTVGTAGADSGSFYGTFDQGGNVAEWNEAILVSSTQRGLRGGDWAGFTANLMSSDQQDALPTAESSRIGFRVATAIPEPTSFLYGGVVALAFACWKLASQRRAG